ncbi:uncharacterized protein LOC119689509 [Teleopsis dalmanni]|uniref:uncharacterized protein LOC119689509 n=1 Tax=Teleopsis dalmanni TaxID=139649 RepID=UPI0018CFE416|nr:uncharacterized protein LOC119689509 [Teleopsis dalmanni]
METDKLHPMPMDDVDFSSGYETQYAKEYRPVHSIVVPKPDKANAWYRDLQTIFVVLFLVTVFLIGSIMLIMFVFSQNPWHVFAFTSIYIILALIVIFIEVKSVHVR